MKYITIHCHMSISGLRERTTGSKYIYFHFVDHRHMLEKVLSSNQKQMQVRCRTSLGILEAKSPGRKWRSRGNHIRQNVMNITRALSLLSPDFQTDFQTSSHSDLTFSSFFPSFLSYSKFLRDHTHLIDRSLPYRLIDPTHHVPARTEEHRPLCCGAAE